MSTEDIARCKPRMAVDTMHAHILTTSPHHVVIAVTTSLAGPVAPHARVLEGVIGFRSVCGDAV